MIVASDSWQRGLSKSRTAYRAKQGRKWRLSPEIRAQFAATFLCRGSYLGDTRRDEEGRGGSEEGGGVRAAHRGFTGASRHVRN